MRTIPKPFVFLPYFALIALLGAVAGCSSPASEPTLYLLRNAPVERTGLVTGKPRVGLGRVVVAPYLMADDGIVLETEPNVVRHAFQHQWAEALDQGLRWFLRVEIGRALGDDVGGGISDIADWDYTIDVYIARMHGNMQGEVFLESAYVIRPRHDRTAISEYRFTRKTALTEAGYPALVAGHRKLLTELGEAIAEGLQQADPLPGGAQEAQDAPADIE